MKKKYLFIYTALIICFFQSANAQKFAWAELIEKEPNSYIYDIAYDQAGNIYVAGNFGRISFNQQDTITAAACNTSGDSFEHYEGDIFLAKFNSNGEFLWVKQESSAGCEEAVSSISVDSEGNVYLLAHFFTEFSLSNGDVIPFIQPPWYGYDPNATRILIIKYNPNGEIIWHNHSENDRTYELITKKIEIDNEGNIYTLMNLKGRIFWNGDTLNTVLNEGDLKEALVVSKFDKNMNRLWHKLLKSENFNFYEHDFTVDAEGNSFVTGQAGYYLTLDGDTIINFGDNSNTPADFFVLKLNSDGELAWIRTADNNSYTFGRTSIVLDSQGDCYVAGNYRDTLVMENTTLTNPNGGIFLAKFNKDTGVPLLLKGYDDAPSNYVQLYDLEIDANDNLYLNGNFANSAKFGDYLLWGNNNSNLFILKVNPTGEIVWATQPISGYTFETEMTIDEFANVYLVGGFGDKVIFSCDTLNAVSYRNLFMTKIIQVPQNITLATGTPASFCQFTFDNLITANPVPGASNYAWVFADGVNPDYFRLNNPTEGPQTSLTVFYATPGDYTLEIIAYNECFEVLGRGQVTITILPRARFVVIGLVEGNQFVCQNTNNVVYQVNEMYNVESYHWTLPVGVVPVDGQYITTGRQITVNFTATAQLGAIRATGYNSLCGLGDFAIKNILVYQQAPVPIISGTKDVCVGQNNITYTVPYSAQVQSYEWILPAGVVPTNGSTTTYSPEIRVNISANAQSGAIKVKAVNQCSESAFSPEFLLQVHRIPAKPAQITGLNAVCVGQSQVTYTVPILQDVTEYIWTLPNGCTPVSGTNSTQSNSITVNFAANAQTGAIQVRGKNLCGTGENSTAYTIQIDTPALPASAINGLSGICKGQSNVNYSINAIPNANQYIWNLPIGVSPTNGTNITTTNTIVLNFSDSFAGGEISVKAQNGCGAGAASPVLAIAVTQKPEQAGNIAGESKPCQGANNIYQIPAIIHASQYEWILPNGVSPTNGTNITTSPQISLQFGASPTSGIIQVKGKNACFEGIASVAFQFNVIPPLSKPNNIVGNNKLCINTENVSYQIPMVAQASEYIWELPTGVSITSGKFTNQIQVHFTQQAESGYISVKAKNQCFESEPTLLWVEVEQDIPAKPQIILDCDILKSYEDLENYQWYKDNQLIPDASRKQYLIQSAGIYFLRTQNTCGYVDSDIITFERNECKTALYLPTAFSPNGDGLNDVLEIFGQNFTNLRLTIFNRWGEVVFIARNKNEQWNGMVGGQSAPEGVYTWKANFESAVEKGQKIQKTGSITLVR